MQKEYDQLWIDAKEAYTSGDVSKAIELYCKLGDNGYSSGAATAGILFEEKGRQEKLFYSDALHWYSKSLQVEDNMEAHRGLARYYYYGFGGNQEWELAQHHLERSNLEGDMQYNLMLAFILHDKKNSKPEDKIRAKEIFDIAASEGYAGGIVGKLKIAKNKRRYFQFFFLAIQLTVRISKLVKNKKDPRLFGIKSYGQF
jgi:TPR repeat protein